MNTLVTLILVVACFNAYVYGGSHLICKQLDEVFTSQPAPTGPSNSYRLRSGKRVIKGRKGEVGRTGPKGDQGIVRYDLVNKTLKEYISENEREQDRRISSLEESLAAMNKSLQKALSLADESKQDQTNSRQEASPETLHESVQESLILEDEREQNRKNSQQEASPLIMNESVQGSLVLEADCPIRYNNKCYIPKTDTTRNVAAGLDICAEMSGTLANIYDKPQMDHLMENIRSNHLGEKSLRNFWTGMTINLLNGEVNLSDGRPAPYSRWHTGAPYTTSSHTNIILSVRKSPSSPHQYMWNYDPLYSNYILCEI